MQWLRCRVWDVVSEIRCGRAGAMSAALIATLEETDGNVSPRFAAINGASGAISGGSSAIYGAFIAAALPVMVSAQPFPWTRGAGVVCTECKAHTRDQTL